MIDANEKELVWYIKTELIQEVRVKQDGILIILAQEYEGSEVFSLPIDYQSSQEIAVWLNAIAAEFN